MSRDVFPLLDLKELVMCLQSCDFSLANEESIFKPTSHYMIKLYEQIIKGFTGVSTDSYLASTRDGTEEDEIMFFGTLQILTLNRTCYKFFQNIGVEDFNMTDLNKPEYERSRRLLSAVVNYARFREERMFDCKRFISEMEVLLDNLRSKFDDFNLLQRQTRDIEEEINSIEPRPTDADKNELISLEEKNKSLESQLKKLTRIQEALSLDYNNYKLEKQKLLKELETLGYQLVELESKREKLEKYSQTDMKELSNSMNELNGLLKDKQNTLEELQQKKNVLQTSSQTFEKVIDELYELLRIISTDLQEYHRTETTLIEIKQQLVSSRDNLNNILSSSILYKFSILQDQLKSQQKRFDELQKETEEQSKHNKARIDDLNNKYSEEILTSIQDAEKYIQRDLINGELKSLENEMHELQDGFNKELDNIEREYSLLVGHINRYMGSVLEQLDISAGY